MVIIIGHGPSLNGRNRGEEIDEFETVIRLANMPPNRTIDAIPLTHNDHGKKTDYFVVSTADCKHLITKRIVPNQGTWVFSRPGKMDKGVEAAYSKYKARCSYEPDKWLNRFDEIGARNLREWSKAFPCNGTMAIILAHEILKPKAIYLAGFDAWWDYTVTERGGHDYIAERILLAEMGVKLRKF